MKNFAINFTDLSNNAVISDLYRKYAKAYHKGTEEEKQAREALMTAVNEANKNLKLDQFKAVKTCSDMLDDILFKQVIIREGAKSVQLAFKDCACSIDDVASRELKGSDHDSYESMTEDLYNLLKDSVNAHTNICQVSNGKVTTSANKILDLFKVEARFTSYNAKELKAQFMQLSAKGDGYKNMNKTAFKVAFCKILASVKSGHVLQTLDKNTNTVDVISIPEEKKENVA